MSIADKEMRSAAPLSAMSRPVFSSQRRERIDALKRKISQGAGDRQTIADDAFIYGVTPCEDPYVVG